MVSTEVLERYAIDGYFIADDVLDPAMLSRLREAAPRVKAKARSKRSTSTTTTPPPTIPGSSTAS